jgi:ribosomal protein S18 acetylase RimI-like enzyme
MLGCEAWKLWLHQPEDVDTIANCLDGAHADVVFCFTIFNHDNFRALQQLGFDLISVRNTYERPMPQPVAFAAPAGIELTTASVAKQRIQADDLAVLADVLGTTSRYYKDRRISPNKSRAVYVAWLNNSVFNGYAVDSVLAFQGERLVGIHTVKVRNEVGVIDLIGIAPDLQNAGLGGALLEGGLAIMRTRGATRVEVITENENIQGSRFYQKHGFRLTDMKLVWHRHAVRHT